MSFEIKQQLEQLNEQIKPDLVDIPCNSWEARYSNVCKGYEQKRIQIIQDEYLAKLIQNEEFLNELKTNKDFMQTLNSGKINFIIFLNHQNNKGF